MAGGAAFEICAMAATCQTGTVGELAGEMNLPFGVATDAAGNVYVAELLNNRIQKFDSQGNFLLTWGKDVIDNGVMVDGFEVCMAGGADPCKAGTLGGLEGEMRNPADVATDSAGNVYVADLNNHRVQKFSSSGSFQRTWGEDVIDNGGGSIGFEVCVAGGPDPCKIGVTTAPALGGDLNNPSAVATDSAGNVYVGDSAHLRVQKFDSLGAFQRTWGEDVVSNGAGSVGFEICVVGGPNPCKTGDDNSPFGEAGEMRSPDSIATDGAGNVYVADVIYHRVQKFDALGAPQRAWGEDVINNGGGNVGFEICLAGAPDPCKIGVTTAPALAGEMAFPGGIAIDPAGNVYVGDFAHDRVQKFDLLGNFQRAWGEDVVSMGPGDTMASEFEICVAASGDVCQAGTAVGDALGGEMDGPEGVATDAVGTLYVVDRNLNRIQKFTGDPLPPVSPAPPVAAPLGPAAGPKKCKKRKKRKKRGAAAAKRCKKKKRKKR